MCQMHPKEQSAIEVSICFEGNGSAFFLLFFFIQAPRGNEACCWRNITISVGKELKPL